MAYHSIISARERHSRTAHDAHVQAYALAELIRQHLAMHGGDAQAMLRDFV